MTNEELNQARIAEAMRRRQHTIITDRSVVEHLCDVFCENWTPPEPVDPDLEAARIYANSFLPTTPESWNERVLAFRAGCARGREGAKVLVEALDAIANEYPPEGDGHEQGPSHLWLWAQMRARSALASAKRGG